MRQHYTPALPCLHEVGSEEEAPCGVLHPFTHLHHVTQDELGGGLAAAHVARPRCAMAGPDSKEGEQAYQQQGAPATRCQDTRRTSSTTA